MAKAATKPAVATFAKAAGGVAKAEVGSDDVWVRTKSGVARRYRAGLAFSAAPIMLPVGELSHEQFDAIEADPLLVQVDAPAAEAEPIKTVKAAE
jgi:hypothetical protein